jgi:uncharacterized protein YukE
MRLVDGGYGYTIPGDPGAIRAAAAQLRAVASAVGQVQGTTTAAAGEVAGSWQGTAATAFQGTARRTATGLNVLATGATTAASALAAFATVLERAQQQAAKATASLTSAGTGYDAAVRDAENLAGKAATTAADDALSAYRRLSSSADAMAASARLEVANAARIASATLATVGSDVSRGSLHEVADNLGGPGTALSVLYLEQQGVSWGKVVQAYNAVKSVDPEKLRAADPAEYEKFETLVKDLETGDANGLVEQIKMKDSVMINALARAKNAAVPGAGDSTLSDTKVAAEDSNKLLDVLGRLGLGLAVVGDVDTLFLNKDATGLDKGMAGANLAGIGAVEFGSQAAFALELNAATDAIPIVGEVVIAGTAVYFAQEWARAHWGEIKQWSADAAHGIENAATWTNDKLNEFNTMVDHTLATGGKDLVHVGEQAANDIASAGSTALHIGGNVANGAVHDLNPMNW